MLMFYNKSFEKSSGLKMTFFSLLLCLPLQACNCYDLLQKAHSTHIDYTSEEALFHFNIPSSAHCSLKKLILHIPASPPFAVIDKNDRGEMVTDWSFFATNYQKFDEYFKNNANVYQSGYQCQYIAIAFGMFIRGETRTF